MKQINRNVFLKQSFKLGALALLNPSASQLMATTASEGPEADTIFQRATAANDIQVGKLLANTAPFSFGRRNGFEFAALADAYTAPGSEYYHAPSMVVAMEYIADQLLSIQTADGTLSFGNLESPPDTAFLMEPLCSAAWILIKGHQSPAVGTVLK